MLGDDIFFGTSAVGALENRDIESRAIVNGSVNDIGLVVGESVIDTGTAPKDSLHLATDDSVVPIGVSCPSMKFNETGSAAICTNVNLFRDSQSKSFQTNDETATKGAEVFTDGTGKVTTQATTGWRLGLCDSYEVESFLNIEGEKKPGIMVETAKPLWVGA
jgi:hypothetical protein